MKRIAKFFGAFCLLLVSAIACREDDTLRPDMNDNIGAVTNITRNNDHAFFNYLDPLTDQYIEFGINVNGFDVTQINTVDIELVYTDKERNYDPFQEIYVDSVFAPVLLKTVSTFPSTIQVSAAEIVAALGLESIDDFELGDSFNLTFPINTADGRRLTVALNSELCNQPAQPSFGGCNVQWAIACPSDIQTGTYEVYVEGTDQTYEVEVTAEGAGVYSIDNFNLDYDLDFYGSFTDLPVNAQFTDVCNEIELTGVSDYDVAWRGEIVYDPVAKTLTVSEVTDVGYGQGPFNNGGAGYVLTYKP